jgi:hypothetical protein
MRLLNLIFILSIGQLFMDCNRKNNNDQPGIEIKKVTLVEEVDDVSPPPPEMHSNFETLQEWLFNMCDKEKPKVKIATYEFGLFESPGDYTVFVVGLNTYQKSEHHSVTTIDFEPSDMYFPLPENEHENSDREQVLDKIKSQLKDFTKTEKFKTSFFAQAKSIKTSFDGDEIWSK